MLYAQFHTNNKDQFPRVLDQPQLSSFKKLLVLTPSLSQVLYMMSLAKAVPDSLRYPECKRTALDKCPPVSFIPEKDEVQEKVSLMKGLHLKSSIGEDTTLHLSMWNINMKRAMLMHLGSTLDEVKKRGHFQDYKTAQVLFVTYKEAAKQARADLALLDIVRKVLDKSKKPSKKAREAEAAAKASDPEMQAMFLLDLKKAKEAAENAKGAMTTAANKIFGFYANLLLVEAKYMWNNIDVCILLQFALGPLKTKKKYWQNKIFL
jgi:hypothetical protein